jgi:hypothetical protein
MASTRFELLAKKTKIPRPPNAFILYRKKHHPLVAAENPNIANNDISVILGRQWKNEPDRIKREYKSLAEKIKRQHALDNSGYHYAPRKPSEKKRRMTAKKLAAQKAAAEETVWPTFPQTEMVEVADHVNSETETLVDMADGSDWFGTLDPVPAIQINDKTLDVCLAFPTTDAAFEELIATHYHRADALLPFDPHCLSTTSAPQATSEQNFLESLIDWNGIRQDAETLEHATAEERDELVAVETGTSQQIAWDPASISEFQSEINDIMAMV